jgi:predicted nucleic acid-binding protein
MAIRKEIIVVISPLVLIETARNLYEKAADKAHLFEVIIEHVPFEYVQPTKREVLAAVDHVELKDAPIIAAAKKAKVDLVVTLDKKHLLGKPVLVRFVGVDIVTPNEAVKRL